MVTVSAILAAGTVHWLIDLHWGGRVYRFADDDVVVTDEAGSDYQYRAGLVLGALDPEPESVGIELDSGDDWAQLLARGHALERRRCVLRRWYEGQTLEEARVVLDGYTEGVAVGSTEEPVSFDLVRDGRVRSRLVPPPSTLTDATTWPTDRGGASVGVFALEDRARGHHVPVVIGCPGHAPGEPLPLPAVPALSVEWKASKGDSRFAFHHGEADATSVVLWNESAAPITSTTVTVGQMDDLIGQDTAYVEYGTAGVPDNADWYVGMQDDATYGGGIPNRKKSGPLRGFGEVARHLLERWGRAPVDVGRMESESARLDRYKIDGYINSPSHAEEWLDSITPHLPVWRRRSEQGIWYQHWRWDAAATDAVGSLDADEYDVRRVSPLELEQRQVANEFTIRYRRLRESQSYHSVRVLSAENQYAGEEQFRYGYKADSRVIGSSLLRQSQGVYGLRPRPPLASAWLWDDDTVALIMQQWALAYAFPRLTVAYSGPLTLERYELGDVVLLTDSELHLTDEPALVMGRSDGLTDIELRLTILRTPGRSTRAIT